MSILSVAILTRGECEFGRSERIVGKRRKCVQTGVDSFQEAGEEKAAPRKRYIKVGQKSRSSMGGTTKRLEENSKTTCPTLPRSDPLQSANANRAKTSNPAFLGNITWTMHEERVKEKQKQLTPGSSFDCFYGVLVGPSSIPWIPDLIHPSNFPAAGSMIDCPSSRNPKKKKAETPDDACRISMLARNAINRLLLLFSG